MIFIEHKLSNTIVGQSTSMNTTEQDQGNLSFQTQNVYIVHGKRSQINRKLEDLWQREGC